MISECEREALRAEIVPAVACQDAKAFLVTARGESDEPRVEIHTMRDVGGRFDTAPISRRLRGSRRRARVARRRHSADGLARKRSLEAMLDALGCEAIIYDPTAVFTRASALVGFAGRLRSEAVSSIRGIYWSGSWRTLFVALDPGSFISGDKIDLARVRDVENAIRAAFRSACGPEGIDYVKALRITFSAPPTGVTPVDIRSEPSRSELPKQVTRGIGGLVVGASLGFGGLAGTAQAQDTKPAVSAVNGTLSIIGGGFSSTDYSAAGPGRTALDIGGTSGAFIGVGSVTFPVAHSFGVQVDAGAGVANGDFTAGTGIHVFYRDPDSMLLGLIGSYSGISQDRFVPSGATFVRDEEWLNIGRAGVEGEVYLDRFSILARAGYQFGDGEDDFFGNLSVAYYPLDDLMVSAGPEYLPGVGIAGAFDIEYLEPFNESLGLSVFVDGAIHDADNYRAFVGIRLYFGESKPLIRRHREDDPRPDLFVDAIVHGSTAKSYFY